MNYVTKSGIHVVLTKNAGSLETWVFVDVILSDSEVKVHHAFNVIMPLRKKTSIVER